MLFSCISWEIHHPNSRNYLTFFRSLNFNQQPAQFPMDFRSGTQVLKILEDGLVEHLEPPAFCLTAVEGKVAQPARECPRDFVAWARFCVDSAVGEMVSRWFLLGNGERSFEAEVLNQLIICFLNTKVFLRV